MGRRDSRLGVTCVANNSPTAKFPVPTDVDSSKHQTPQSYEDISCDARGISKKFRMPPASSQSSAGKKGGGASAMRQQNRSRNTTPSSVPPGASLPPMESIETDLLDLRFELFRNLTYEDMVDPGASGSVIPDSKSLDGMVTRLTKLGDVIERRGQNCDRGMRLLAQSRKSRMDEFAAERGREEERRQREADDEERERKANKKKRKASDNLAPQPSNVGELFALSLYFFFPCSKCPPSHASAYFVALARRGGFPTSP